jgi:hypothetical protein
MAIRYVKDFEFPSAAGFTSSSPSKVTGPMFAKGGQAKMPKAPGLMVLIGVGKKSPMKKAEGGDVDRESMSRMAGDAAAAEYADQTMAPRAKMTEAQRIKALQMAKRRQMQSGEDTRVNDVPPSANYSSDQMDRAERGYKKGGKVAKVMGEFGEGKLHSGSKKGPKVTNPKQAVAIALSEQRAAKKSRGGVQYIDKGKDTSVPVKDIKSGKIPQSTDEDFYGKAKDMPMPPRRPSMLKKGGYAEGGKAVKVPLPAEDEAPYPAQWPMPSYEQINKENWNQRKAIRRAMGAKNTGKDTFAKGGATHDDAAQDKAMIKSMIKPSALKKADGGMAMQSPLQQMASRPRGVPVAPQGPMIAQQAAPAGGPRIGVGRSRMGKPNVGAIRAAMAKAATQAMPENAPGMMKKGGKVKC